MPKNVSKRFDMLRYAAALPRPVDLVRLLLLLVLVGAAACASPAATPPPPARAVAPAAGAKPALQLYEFYSPF